MFEALGKMLHSIYTTDLYILVAAIIELIFFFGAKTLAKNSTIGFDGNGKKKKATNRLFVNVYNLFTTGISVFPLLGMLGTVGGLLGLDLAAGDISNIKNNFFMALTSTAWGIVFSMMFKILYAWNEYYFEQKIEESAELTKECNKIFEKENR